MHTAKPDGTGNYKLDKVQALTRRAIKLVKDRYTGKLILHWHEGELKEIEEHKRTKLS